MLERWNGGRLGSWKIGKLVRWSGKHSNVHTCQSASVRCLLAEFHGIVSKEIRFMAPNEHTRAKDPCHGPEFTPTKNRCFLANETRKLHLSQTMARQSWPLGAGKVPEPIEASRNLTVVWEVRFFTSARSAKCRSMRDFEKKNPLKTVASG